jgi:hypothetical protein
LLYIEGKLQRNNQITEILQPHLKAFFPLRSLGSLARYEDKRCVTKLLEMRKSEQFVRGGDRNLLRSSAVLVVKSIGALVTKVTLAAASVSTSALHSLKADRSREGERKMQIFSR